jgi:hypothetical protein
MSPWSSLGKWLIIIGVVLAAVGLLLQLFPKLPIGRLPGDIVWERPGLKVYIPITTSIVVSIVLSIIVYFLNK